MYGFTQKKLNYFNLLNIAVQYKIFDLIWEQQKI